MKQILDRLMARQQRLLGELASPSSEPDHTPALSVEERSARATQEAAALDAALEELAVGHIIAAKALLQPFAGQATLARTLTTLSRIASSDGDLDRAVDLLRQAERLDPMDRKVWRLLAQALSTRGLHTEEVHYCRRMAFVDPDAPAQAYVDLVRAIYRASPSGKTKAGSEVQLASKRLMAAKDLTDAVRMQFAQAQYVFEGMAKEAREHYAAASPCQPGQRDVAAKWLRLVDWCTRTAAPMQRLLDAGVPAHRPSVATLSDVLVFPGLQWAPVVDQGRIALSGFMMQRVKLRSEDPHTPLLMNRNSHCELRIPVSPPVIDTPAILIGGMNQYYHNTVEMLSALAVAETLGTDPTKPLVVNDDLGAFQLEQLSLLGYGPERLIKVKASTPVLFQNLTVPSRLVRGGQWIDPLVPQWYRRRLVQSTASQSAGRRLYVSRAGTSRRRIANEDELITMLSGHGFEIVHPETLTVRDQIDLFSRASHIVGATGAGMTNMLFASPGSLVVTLYNKYFVSGRGDLYFDAMAKACGHAFRPLHCSPARVVTGQRVIDSDITVDIDAVRAAIEP
jgi:capsular polysaccharide biosynthesis protein